LEVVGVVSIDMLHVDRGECITSGLMRDEGHKAATARAATIHILRSVA